MDDAFKNKRAVYDLMRSYGYHEGSYGELRRPGTTLTAVSGDKRREDDVLAVVQHLLDEAFAEVVCVRWCGWRGPRRRLQQGNRCPLCSHPIPRPSSDSSLRADPPSGRGD